MPMVQPRPRSASVGCTQLPGYRQKQRQAEYNQQHAKNARAALDFASRQKTGSVGAMLDHRSSRPTRNHALDHRRSLREQATQLRQKKQETAELALSKPFKLRQFTNVPSRHMDTCSQLSTTRSHPPATPPATPPRPWSSSTRVASSPASERRGRNCLETPEKLPESFCTLLRAQTQSFSAKLHGISLSPPKADGTRMERGWNADGRAWDHDDEFDTHSDGISEHSHFDVHEFSRTANSHQTQSSRPPPDTNMPSGTTDDQILLEHQQAASSIPTGYRVLQESDRLDMLDTLQDKLDDLNTQYVKLPLRIETASQCNMQKELRTKIAEAEAAVKLFSRPGLLIEK